MLILYNIKNKKQKNILPYFIYKMEEYPLQDPIVVPPFSSTLQLSFSSLHRLAARVGSTISNYFLWPPPLSPVFSSLFLLLLLLLFYHLVYVCFSSSSSILFLVFSYLLFVQYDVCMPLLPFFISCLIFLINIFIVHSIHSSSSF